jgi:hypothetical protein
MSLVRVNHRLVHLRLHHARIERGGALHPGQRGVGIRLEQERVQAIREVHLRERRIQALRAFDRLARAGPAG